jgi:hypothetical protein
MASAKNPKQSSNKSQVPQVVISAVLRLVDWYAEKARDSQADAKDHRREQPDLPSKRTNRKRQ